MNWLLPCLMSVLCLLAGPIMVLSSSAAVPGEPALVLAKPWGPSAPDLIIAAGGVPIGPYSAPIATLAASDDVNFLKRLNTGKAWLVLDGRRLAAICGELI